jgi:hypothetical protein
MPNSRPSYSPKFRAGAVRLVCQEGHTILGVEADLGCSAESPLLTGRMGNFQSPPKLGSLGRIASPAPSLASRPLLRRVDHADRAHVGGCAEPHHRETGNRRLQGDGDRTVSTHKSDVKARGRDDGNGPHPWTTISTSQSSNSASVRSTMTAPMPVSIFVRRPTCQRPSRRTSPVEVAISRGSRRWRLGAVTATGGGRLRMNEANSASE